MSWAWHWCGVRPWTIRQKLLGSLTQLAVFVVFAPGLLLAMWLTYAARG